MSVQRPGRVRSCVRTELELYLNKGLIKDKLLLEYFVSMFLLSLCICLQFMIMHICFEC